MGALSHRAGFRAIVAVGVRAGLGIVCADFASSLRGHLLLLVARTTAACVFGLPRLSYRRFWRTCSVGQSIRARSREGRRLCVSHQPHRRAGMAQRSVVLAGRSLLLGSWRLTAGISAAARFVAVGG